MLRLPARPDVHSHIDGAPAPQALPAARRSALRVLIADDHEMIRFAIRCALAGLADRIEWREAECADAVGAAFDEVPDLDLAMLDFTMPGGGTIGWIASLRARRPSLPMIVITALEDMALVGRLIALGVAGYIPKTDPPRVIRSAVELVLAGGSYVPSRLLARQACDRDSAALSAGTAVSALGELPMLTPRQTDVMRLLARGKPNKLIARELGMSEATVKVHLLAIFRAFGVRNRTEAVLAAQRIVACPF